LASKPKPQTPSGPEITMEVADGRTLRVARWRFDEGLTKPPLLFFNGIGANMEAVAPFAEMMEERPFITFDMPGVGGSPDPKVPYNAFLMSRIAWLLLDRFGIDSVDVMGVSWGGAMAQHFALQHSGSVNRLVLAATTAGMFMVPGNISALSKMADPRRYIDPGYMEKHFATLYGGSTDGASGHTGRITAPSKMGYFYQLLAMIGWTSAPFLPFLGKPTLILMGGDDQIVPVANGHILKTLIRNSQLRIIEDGGHLFMLSHLDESLEAIREHLDAVEE
jgi:poly(3-hydroxyalkanoate) depolymerase